MIINLLLLACSICSLMYPRTACSGPAPPTVKEWRLTAFSEGGKISHVWESCKLQDSHVSLPKVIDAANNCRGGF